MKLRFTDGGLVAVPQLRVPGGCRRIGVDGNLEALDQRLVAIEPVSATHRNL